MYVFVVILQDATAPYGPRPCVEGIYGDDKGRAC